MGWKSKHTYSFPSDLQSKDSIHSFPFYAGIIGIIILTGLVPLVYFVDDILPTPLTISDENTNLDAFISERASWDVKNLTDIGCKIVGSYENEYLAVEYLLQRINKTLNEAHSNQHIELDTQLVSGAYFLKYSEGFINSYDKVQNIVVKIHGKNSSNHSLLINSHFDSAPTSPGGSDDGINVAVMLEVLRLFAIAQDRPLHNIIFLFNGAEETPLQASHGFIMQHKWAKQCKLILNLDAAGAGGKIILFQTGPETPWLVKYYSQVPHPYGQVAGEEIFQSGIIPSDTDYRIFRDFGGLVGLDMAFIKNGYRYHTSYDGFSNIPLGSYQHVGDNVLSLVKSLANCPEMYETVPSAGKAVYFDVFGLFLISYSTLVGSILNLTTVILSFGVFLYSLFSFQLRFSKTTFKYLSFVLMAILGSWLLSGIFIFVVAVALDLLGHSMSWYANPWLIYGLYIIPVTGLSGSLLLLTNHESISLGIRCQIQAHVVRLIWTLVLAVAVYFNIRAVYAIMVPVLFNAVAFLVIHVAHLQHSVKKWQIVYIIFLIIPWMNLIYQAIITLSLFIPMTGRMGSNKNPELLIGFMTFFFTILVISPLTIFTNSLRRAKYYFIILATIFVIFLAITFTPLGFPYRVDDNNPRPQRQWILHTSRRFFNETGDITKQNSGFFFLNLDRNSPNILRDHVKELTNAISIEADCKHYAACGLPLSHPLMLKIVEYSTWVPAEPPNLPDQVNFTVLSTEKLSPTRVRYNISTTGPDRMTFYLIPKSNTTLTNISLVNTLNRPKHFFQDRPMYFIIYQLGKGDMNYHFDFTVEIPEGWSGPVMDVVVIGRYVHDNKMKKTPHFLQMLSHLPNWVDTIAWLASYDAYVI